MSGGVGGAGGRRGPAGSTAPPRLLLLLLLLMLACGVTITGGQELRITPQGRQVKTVNSGIIFTCTILDFPGNDVPEIRWYRPDNMAILETVGRVYVEKENERSKKLYIRAISAADAGRYTCRVTFLERTWTQTVSIILYEEIRFMDTPQTVTAKVGDNAFIPCHANGNPEPAISWRFKRQRVPEASSKYNYELNQNPKGLTIFSVEQRDAGIYECRAEVVEQGALKVRIVTLDVLYPPIMEQKPNSTSAIKGADITLHCKANGNPAVEYIWHKEHKVTYLFQEQVLSGGVKLKVKLGRGPHKTSHVIRNVAERDEGRYFCKARNDIGEVEGHADITLMVPPEIDPLPHKVQVLGDALILPCRATGKPEPLITWRKVGSSTVWRGDRPIADARVQVDSSLRGIARLIINGVRPSDSGSYTCTASNNADTASRNATLTVEFKPVMVTPGAEAFSWRDETRRFNCTAQGEPTPSITWFRNNEYLRSNGTYLITRKRGTSILQITVGRRDGWLFGTYSCMAKNPRGTTKQNFHLRQALPPPQPSNVTVAEENETSVTLTADVGQAVGGLPVTSWRVMYTQVKGSNKPRTFFFGNGEKMRVNGLKAGMVYNFRLAAGNLVGFGKDDKFKVRTPREVLLEPTAAPGPRTTTDALQGGNHTLLRSKQEKGLAGEKREVVSEKKPLSPTSSGFLIAIIGAVLTIVLISLTATLSFFVCRRKRHRERAAPRTVVRKGKKDVDEGFELNMRRKESPLPDVVHKDQYVAETVGNGHVTAGTGPVPNGGAAPGGGGSGGPGGPQANMSVACMSPHMHVKQRVAWNQMIRRAEMESEDEDDPQQQQLHQLQQQQLQHHQQQQQLAAQRSGQLPTSKLLPQHAVQQQHQQQYRGGTTPGRRGPPQNEDVSPYNELPPPPPFLLDSNAAVTQQNYADMFDGYHSGDNVDDCLDELDGPIDANYTIRLQHHGGHSYT